MPSSLNIDYVNIILNYDKNTNMYLLIAYYILEDLSVYMFYFIYYYNIHWLNARLLFC